MTTGTSRVIVGGIIVVGLVALGGWYYSNRETNYSSITTFQGCKDAGYQIMESYPERCQTPDGRQFVNEAQGTPSTSVEETSSVVTGNGQANLRNLNVTVNQTITSPMQLTGEARGWYFEASFPVEVIDGNGKQLYIGPATAQSDWMTSEFVPFSVTVTFEKPTTATGTLILRNDNPSGLPENSQEVRIPVRFSQAMRSVKLYYYDSRLDKDSNGNILCSAKGLVPVTRSIPVTLSPIKDVITLLLEGGLTSEEKATGVGTEFPLPQVSLTSAALSSNGALTLAIADPQQRTSGGACRAQVLRAQVEETARQFTEVTTVTFSPATVFQP